MPELKCTVQTCLHNKNFYCDLDGIVVGGNQAKRAEETCCDSFEERKGYSYGNRAGEASAQAILTVRLPNASIMKIVSVMQERSVWKAVTPVSVSRQNARHFQKKETLNLAKHKGK